MGYLVWVFTSLIPWSTRESSSFAILLTSPFNLLYIFSDFHLKIFTRDFFKKKSASESAFRKHYLLKLFDSEKIEIIFKGFGFLFFGIRKLLYRSNHHGCLGASQIDRFHAFDQAGSPTPRK
jgi:hypothetical protein